MSPVLSEIQAERQRQDEKWGQQDHPSFDPLLMQRGAECTPQRMALELEIPTEERAKFLCNNAFAHGYGNFSTILVEEVSEAVGALADDARLREELIQVAAVAVAWVEALDRRAAA